MTTMLVCSIGGHLSQLHALAPQISEVDRDDVVWVTHDSPQSRSLLEGERVEFVPYIDERDALGVARESRNALRLLRHTGADLVVSTGSAIAGAYLPLAAAMGRQAAFIESAAMVDAHTRTGKMLQAVPAVKLFTQSKTTVGRRWQYCGSVFDGFEASSPLASDLLPRRMVVTVGTSREFGFRGLLEKLAALIPVGVDVLWQTGETDTEGLDIEPTPWLAASELSAEMHRADVVVSHAGGGSALACLLEGRRPILVPRRADRQEFRDDHQVQIARQLAQRGLAEHAELETLTWDTLVSAAGWSVSPTPQRAPISLR